MNGTKGNSKVLQQQSLRGKAKVLKENKGVKPRAGKVKGIEE
jgi:hypothetical protein